MYVFSFYAPICYYLRVNALYWMTNSGGRTKAPAETRQRCCCFLWLDGRALSMAVLTKLTD